MVDSVQDAGIRKKSDQAALPLVERNMSSAIQLKADGSIWQDQQLIGRFEDARRSPDGMERCRILLPEGQVLANISFDPLSNGVYTVETLSDGFWHPLEIGEDKLRNAARIESSQGAGRHEAALKRLIPWLIAQGYL